MLAFFDRICYFKQTEHTFCIEAYIDLDLWVNYNVKEQVMYE